MTKIPKNKPADDLEEDKRLEKDIFINTGKINIVLFFSIWNL